jgi:hypothetical protein
MASISANGSNGHHKFTLNVTETATSTANNASTISWSFVLSSLGGNYDWYYNNTVPVTYTVTINGTRYSGNIMSYDGSSTVTVRSGTMTIPHNADGSKSITLAFTVSSQNATYLPGSANASGTMSLTNIPRQATVTNAPDFTDIENPTLTYSNPAGSSADTLQACISLTGASANIAYRDIPKNGSSYTFQLTDAERNVLRQATTNAKSRTVYFYIATTIGGTTYRDNEAATFTVVNASPTFSATYQDTNSTTVAITEDDQDIIRNQSTLQVNITNATALKYASLSTASVTINGNTTSATISGTTATFNLGTQNISAPTTAAVTVTDSRGYSTTRNLTVQMVDWQLPTGIIYCEREQNYYTDTDISCNASYSSVLGKNTCTIQVRYKKVANATWGTYQTLQDGVVSTIALDNNYDWDVQVKLTDLFGSTTYNLVVGRGLPDLYIDTHNHSVGVGCFPKYQESLEVYGKSVFPITLYNSTNGSSADIALNDAIANYSYLEIFYTDNNNTGIGSVRVPTSAANVDLSLVEAGANATYIRRTRYAISGSTLTPNTTSAGYVVFMASQTTAQTTQGTNYLKVLKVLGWE